MTISNPIVVENIDKLQTLRRNRVPRSQLFDRYKNELGQFIIDRLKLINSSRKHDSTFILECARKLFGNDEQLKSITACGRNQANAHLSPAKRKILDDIFIERLSNEQIDEKEAKERYLRLNTLINSALRNMVRLWHIISHILCSSPLLYFQSIILNFYLLYSVQEVESVRKCTN